MKRHEHNKGWADSNDMNVPLWKEYLAIGACYLITIAMTAFVVYVFAKPD